MSATFTLDTGNETYALMVALSQIVNGEETCDYCDHAATLGIATGADPETVPCCYQHAMEFVTVSQAFAAKISGITTG